MVHPKPNILTINEILGLEPPAVRPTRFELAGNSNLIVTDVNPRIIGGNSRVFYKWTKLVAVRTKQLVSDAARSFVTPRQYTLANLGDSYGNGSSKWAARTRTYSSKWLTPPVSASPLSTGS